MKKRLLFMCALALFSCGAIYSQTWIEDVYLFDDFGTTGGTSSGNWVNGTAVYGNATGITTGSGNTFSSAVNATNKNLQIGGKVYNNTFISNTKTFPNTYNPTTGSSASPSTGSGKITISYICKIGSAQTYSGGYYYFRDASNRAIFGLGFARINSGGNKWLAVRPTAYTLWADAAASYPNITASNLLPTAVDGAGLLVTAVLDFSVTPKTVTLTARAGTYTANASPEWVDASPLNQYSATINFLDDNASDVSNMIFELNGSGNTSASTVNPYFTLDNFKIAGQKQSSANANVTVNYVDVDDATVLSSKSVVHSNQPVSSVYTATAAEKATFILDGKYCVYSASASTDNVVVTADGNAQVTLKVKRYAITSGTYKWTGTTNSVWNEINQNFSTDGVNSLGYQARNGVELPIGASNQSIAINDTVNLGANNLNITGTGYTLTSGVSGSINGTGALNIGLTTGNVLTLNATNNLTGTTQISGGNITLSKSGVLGTGVNITGATTLTYGATSVTIPATTFGASSSIVTGSFASSLISGMSAGNGIKISVSAGINYGSNDNTRAFDFAASGTLAAGSELELTGTGTDNRFGMTSASNSYLANTKVTLKGAAMLYINTAQGAASTINVGTLAGETGTKLGWGRTTDLTRTITWSVNSTENSEFAGSITNTGGYASSGSSYIGNLTNFIKTGTGTLTMSGAANTHNGSFVINGGALKVTGAICNTTGAVAGVSAADTVCIGTAGKLTGNGTVGGNTGVYGNGVLEGSLHFGGTLKLTPASTVNLVVNDFAALHDSITIAGAATYDGTLNISIPAALPAYGTTVKLLYVGSYAGTFATVNVPAGYKFDETSGTLSYGFYTKLNDATNKLSVYPTLTNGIVHIQGGEAVSAEVVNLAGQAVKAVNLTNSKSTINLSDLSAGSYFVRIHSNDGSVNTQKVVLQK